MKGVSWVFGWTAVEAITVKSFLAGRAVQTERAVYIRGEFALAAGAPLPLNNLWRGAIPAGFDGFASVCPRLGCLKFWQNN